MRHFLFEFFIKENYDERELENLLEFLEERGATYSHVRGCGYEVMGPEELNYLPFYKTVKECPSVEKMGEYVVYENPRSLTLSKEAKHV